MKEKLTIRSHRRGEMKARKPLMTSVENYDKIDAIAEQVRRPKGEIIDLIIEFAIPYIEVEEEKDD